MASKTDERRSDVGEMIQLRLCVISNRNVCMQRDYCKRKDRLNEPFLFNLSVSLMHFISDLELHLHLLP